MLTKAFKPNNTTFSEDEPLKCRPWKTFYRLWEDNMYQKLIQTENKWRYSSFKIIPLCTVVFLRIMKNVTFSFWKIRRVKALNVHYNLLRWDLLISKETIIRFLSELNGIVLWWREEWKKMISPSFGWYNNFGDLGWE